VPDGRVVAPAVNPFGAHRAVEPEGSLPYMAQQLDPGLPLHPGEALIEVEALNIDSASFTQLLDEAGGDTKHVARRVMQIIDERGKMHNPVTGSGGVLIGTVIQTAGRDRPAVGDRIVTLTSLTTTPLELDAVLEVDARTHQIKATGRAILFDRSPYAILDGTLPERLAMSVLDVCGAATQAQRLAKSGQTVLIAGAAGKSGLLVSWVSASQGARVIGLVRDSAEAERLVRLGIGATPVTCNATDPLAVYHLVRQATDGKMADLVFNCVNVPKAEMSCILAAKPRGLVYFFSMATNFQAAALGAESVGADVDLMIGNGFAEGHADFALSLIRESAPLRASFEQLLG
jgi:L-erythro-3,5-diaminohexanoate dehydrogenase